MCSDSVVELLGKTYGVFSPPAHTTDQPISYFVNLVGKDGTPERIESVPINDDGNLKPVN